MATTCFTTIRVETGIRAWPHIALDYALKNGIDHNTKDAAASQNNDENEDDICPICYDEFTTSATSPDPATSGKVNDLEKGFKIMDYATEKNVDTAKGNNNNNNPQLLHHQHHHQPKKMSITTTKQRIRVERCGHEFCYECLVQHCKIAIASKDTPVPCPQVLENNMNDGNDSHKNDGTCSSNKTIHGHWLSPELMQTLLTAKRPSSRKKDEGRNNESVTTTTWNSPIQVPKMEPILKQGTNSKLVFNNNNSNSNNTKNGEADYEDYDVELGWEGKGAGSIIMKNRTFSTEMGSSCRSSSSSSSSSIGSSSSSSSHCSVTSSPEYWNKYLRIQLLKEDPTLLTCPKCQELVPPPEIPTHPRIVNDALLDLGEEVAVKGNTKGDKDTMVDGKGHTIVSANDNDSDAPAKNPPFDNDHSLPAKTNMDPEVQCHSCQHNFCADHGDIHAGETCEKFCTSQRARDMAKSELEIYKISKQCSHKCGARIVRTAGCDHILCTNCNGDMCYRCGTHEHLTGKVVRSCSKCKQGYVDHRYYAQYRRRMLLTFPFHLIISVVYMAVVGAVASLTCCFGCCFWCGTRGWQWEETEQEATAAASSRKMNPMKGIYMTTRVICHPLVELMADCGFVHHDEEEEHAGNL